MAPTQVKATAEHPASIQKHAANPAAFTSPNATRGPRRSEAEVVRRYRPSQRPRAWGGAASETVAVADDQKEARPTACTQRTKSICQNSAHSGNRMPPSTNDARPTSMTGFVPHRSAAGDNIVAIFGNVFGMIVNLAKAPINGVISAINWVLEKINSISVTIPDWVPGVGGKTLGFNIPTIPALAAGGIATAPTLAQIGEGGEPEAVLPLSKLAALLDEWTKPKPTPGGGTGGGGETVVFSPVFNFYGGTPSREEAEEAGRISFAEFKKLYRQMKAEEKRKQFSPV